MKSTEQIIEAIDQVTRHILEIDEHIEKHIKANGFSDSLELVNDYLDLLFSIKNELLKAYTSTSNTLDEKDLSYIELRDTRDMMEAKWIKLKKQKVDEIATSIRELNAANACDGLGSSEVPPPKKPIKIGRIVVWSVILFTIYCIAVAAFR